MFERMSDPVDPCKGCGFLPEPLSMPLKVLSVHVLNHVVRRDTGEERPSDRGLILLKLGDYGLDSKLRIFLRRHPGLPWRPTMPIGRAAPTG